MTIVTRRTVCVTPSHLWDRHSLLQRFVRSSDYYFFRYGLGSEFSVDWYQHLIHSISMWNCLVVEKFVDWMDEKFISARNYSKNLHWFQTSEPTFIETVLKKKNGSTLIALNRWKIPSLHSCRWRVLFSANASLHYEPNVGNLDHRYNGATNTPMKMPTKIMTKRKNNSNKFMWNEWQRRKKRRRRKCKQQTKIQLWIVTWIFIGERLDDSMRLVSKIMLICEKSSAQSIVRCHLYVVWNISSFEN